MKKKIYITPDIEKIAIDTTISLQMQSDKVPEGGDGESFKPRTDGNKSPSPDPFASPFGDKPFN